VSAAVPLRVLHVQKVKGLGGSERHLLALLPALAARGLEIRMLMLTEGEWRRFADPLDAAGVEVVSVPAGNDLTVRPTLAVGREIRAFAPQLVHTHLIHAGLHGQLAARRHHVPGVATAHNVDPRLRRSPALQVARMAGRRASRTIAISEHVRGYLEQLRLAPPDSIRVVPYGIDLAGRRLSLDDRARARAALGVADHEVAVTVAARLIPGKGLDVLLDAMVPAMQRAPDLRLLVAGDGPARPSLEAQARSLPHGAVRFLGFVDDPRELIGAGDITAFPTLATLGEGFGLTALEAMAAAVPVVASDAGALPEVVEDGRTGLVVPAGQVDPLGEALARLGADATLRSEMGEAGLSRARERFSLAAMVDRTVAVYAEARGTSL
jgi:glycosyltransferase involved in cell wall biosynthesis